MLRRYLIVALALSVAVVAALTALLVYFNPTPPREVLMATDRGGVSADLGEQYRALLAEERVRLRLVPGAGAVESLSRLRDGRSGVSVALVPGGLTRPEKSPELVSLGTTFYQPLWLFHRTSIPVTPDPRQMFRGRKISVGPEGSASRVLSLEFMAQVGIIDQENVTLLPLEPDPAVERLLSGEIDAAILIDSWESPRVRRLLAADAVTLASVRRADAFVALYPYLTKLVLPAGVGDLAANRPPVDVTLLAPKASLIVRRDLHPAIQYLLLDAAVKLHSGPGLFRREGQFPAPEVIDLPLSEPALQFYKTGRPFLQRHLPFWLAAWTQQLLVLLIPVVAVIYPLLRLLPGVYAWTMRRRVFRLYTELKRIEDQITAGPRSELPPSELMARLDRLEE
jgi:TRAP-type uncharacterized transport system substrate-binding protein